MSPLDFHQLHLVALNTEVERVLQADIGDSESVSLSCKKQKVDLLLGVKDMDSKQMKYRTSLQFCLYTMKVLYLALHLLWHHFPDH